MGIQDIFILYIISMTEIMTIKERGHILRDVIC